MTDLLHVLGRLAASSMVCACAAAAVQAQSDETQAPELLDLTELDLEDLMSIEIHDVYGASKRSQSTLDAPSSVSIVTAEEIRSRGYRTLDEVLRSLGGVYSTFDRSYRHSGFRGFFVPGDYNSRVLLTVDGHRVNDNIYGSASIGVESPIDIDTVERVEFIRGPGSALYGSNAVFGVINVVTRDGSADGGLTALAGAGSRRSYEARVAHDGVSSDGWAHHVALRGFDSAGARLMCDEYASSPTGGVTRDTDRESMFGVFADFARDGVQLQAAFARREKGVPTAQYFTNFDDPDNVIIDAQGYVDLSYSATLGEVHELLARVYYDDYAYDGVYVYDDTAQSGVPDLEYHDDVHGRRVGFEAHDAFLWSDCNRLTLGVETRWNIDQDQRYSDEFTTLSTSEKSSLDWGAFAQNEFALGAATTLTLGLRLDGSEGFDAAWSPRAAAVHRLDDATALKLLAGGAYRAPNSYELDYSDGSTTKANPDLDPERITTFELVAERYFTDRARASIALYRNEVDDLISQRIDPNDGLYVFENVDNVRAQGVELQGELVVADGTRIALSHAIQDVENTDTGERPINSPRRVTQARLETALFDDAFTAAIEVIALGPRTTVAGDESDAYAVTNAYLRSRGVLDGIDIELGLYNVFDEQYTDPASEDYLQDQIEQDGFTFMLRLRATL